MTTINVNDPASYKNYPNHRVLAVVDTREDAEHTLERLAHEDGKIGHIEVLHGRSGIDTLDAEGTHHGFLSRVAHALRAVGDVENRMMRIYESALERGAYVLMIPVRSDEEKEIIKRDVEQNHGRDINYFGTWYVEAL